MSVQVLNLKSSYFCLFEFNKESLWFLSFTNLFIYKLPPFIIFYRRAFNPVPIKKKIGTYSCTFRGTYSRMYSGKYLLFMVLCPLLCPLKIMSNQIIFDKVIICTINKIEEKRAIRKIDQICNLLSSIAKFSPFVLSQCPLFCPPKIMSTHAMSHQNMPNMVFRAY